MAPDAPHEVQLRDDEGWSQVKTKTRRGKRRNAPVVEQPGDAHPRTEGLRTVAELGVEYRSTREQWDVSIACTQLRELVADSASTLRTISKGICLGIGTFDPPDGGWETKRKTFVQLVVFLTMIDELGKSTKHNRWSATKAYQPRQNLAFAQRFHASFKTLSLPSQTRD
jgi:hypothetical protein